MYKHYSYPLFPLLSIISLLAILATATATATAIAPNAAPLIVGGRTAIPDVETNKEVQSLGRFAVARYNKNAATKPQAVPLTFSRVVEAEEQVVAGIKYYLKIVAKVGDKYSTAEKLFDAVVVVNPLLKPKKVSRKLVSFTPSP